MRKFQRDTPLPSPSPSPLPPSLSNLICSHLDIWNLKDNEFATGVNSSPPPPGPRNSSPPHIPLLHWRRYLSLLYLPFLPPSTPFSPPDATHPLPYHSFPSSNYYPFTLTLTHPALSILTLISLYNIFSSQLLLIPPLQYSSGFYFLLTTLPPPLLSCRSYPSPLHCLSLHYFTFLYPHLPLLTNHPSLTPSALRLFPFSAY